MKKLMLELSDLRVDSFAVETLDEVRGTVEGQNEPPVTASCGGTCVNTCVSCVNTCQNTCAGSCWGSCTCYTCEIHCTDPRICP